MIRGRVTEANVCRAGSFRHHHRVVSESSRSSLARPSRPFGRAVLATGLLAGTFDGTAAVINFLAHGGTEPVRIAYYIASAVFGRDAAYAGGWSMVVCGILFHYLVACSFTLFFFLLFPRVSLLGKKPVVTGIFYGAFVWLVMNLVVVPLTRTPKGPFNPSRQAIEMAILMLCVGTPVSLLAHRYYSKSENRRTAR